ncbi:MAG: ABC transporter permease, partial [Acidimicrobiia bacterium]
RAYGVDVGDVIVLRDGARSVDHPMNVVGITRAPELPDRGGAWTPSPAFIAAHPEIDKITNLALWLEPGADEATVVDAAAKAVGRDAFPAISLTADIRALYETVRFEATAIRLWALAIALAGVALVGQAIVRTVTAAGYDQRVLGDLGLDRTRRLTALCLPVGMMIAVAVPVAVVGEVLASAWFPIGVARGYALERGRSLDGVLTLLGVVLMALMALAAAIAGSMRATSVSTARSTRAGWLASRALRAPLPLTARIGLRFAVEPGRGARAVPVRSTLCGVGLGIVGVVAAFTFRSGLDDLLRDPARVGWLGELGAQPSDNGERDEETIASLAADDRVEAMAEVNWHRTFLVNGTNVSAWTMRERKGVMRSPVLDGRLPERNDELALGPDSFDDLGLQIGDTVTAGVDRVSLNVVGKVLLPNDSHQGYAFGALMTPEGYAATGSPDRDGSPGEIFGVYMRLATGAQPEGLVPTLAERGWEPVFTTTPGGFDRLGKARFLSLNFSTFLAALALASLAHALVLTVRRRRSELAVLGALGLPRRSLVAVILAQATTIAIGALMIGVPLGVATGRFVCRVVEQTYSFLYVAPAATLLSAIVIALTLVAANLIALAPGAMARRVSPALTLRTE